MWNKTCTQLSLSQILFKNPKSCSLEHVQRFCSHSCCDSTVIFDQISNSRNVYRSSTPFGYTLLWSSSTTSLPSRNRKHHLSTFERFTTSLPLAFGTNTSVSAPNRPTLKDNFMANVCSFPSSVTNKGK